MGRSCIPRLSQAMIETLTAHSTLVSPGSISPAASTASCWYVAFTCVNREKIIAQQLDLRGIERFLPLYEKMSRWRDRVVRLELPLFAGYIFVRIPLAAQLDVLRISGVARFVSFSGELAAVPDTEIETLRRGLEQSRAEPFPYLARGKRVRVRSGALRGMEGVLLQKKSRLRFIVSLEMIQRSIAVEIDSADVEPA